MVEEGRKKKEDQVSESTESAEVCTAAGGRKACQKTARCPCSGGLCCGAVCAGTARQCGYVWWFSSAACQLAVVFCG